MPLNKKDFYRYPNEQGFFEHFGGQFVAETLMYPLQELEYSYNLYSQNSAFQKEILEILNNFVGRPTPLYHAKRWSDSLGGAQIYFKREDLCHTGAHKINNTVGQILLAKKMGKTRIIAETGAGQHGVASATVAALLGIPCVVYMGANDTERQAINVHRMRLLGAEVMPVNSGTKTLKDALNEALRDWVKNVSNTFYCIGSATGPHPYPKMVRDFQKIIGEEVKQQFKAMLGKQPDALVACVGGGSNAIGLFYPFLNDTEVAIYGVEAGGIGQEKHAAPLCTGKPGILHGSKTYLMMNDDGQIQDTHSISAGLDYPGVGPEHSFLKDCKRVEYVSAKDDETLKAFYEVTRLEGIMPALETSHALAFVKEKSLEMSPHKNIVVNLSGRGDKDIQIIRNVEEKSE